MFGERHMPPQAPALRAYYIAWTRYNYRFFRRRRLCRSQHSICQWPIAFNPIWRHYRIPEQIIQWLSSPRKGLTVTLGYAYYDIN